MLGTIYVSIIMDMEVSIYDTHSISFFPKSTLPFVDDMS